MMWDGHWREMMAGWGYFPWGGLHMLFSLAAMALLVAFVISLFSRPQGAQNHNPPPPPDEREQRKGVGLAILEERYVRGEIDRDEFMLKKRDLMG